MGGSTRRIAVTTGGGDVPGVGYAEKTFKLPNPVYFLP